MCLATYVGLQMGEESDCRLQIRGYWGYACLIVLGVGTGPDLDGTVLVLDVSVLGEDACGGL